MVLIGIGMYRTSLMHLDDQLAVGRNDLHRNGSVHVLEAMLCLVMDV